MRCITLLALLAGCASTKSGEATPSDTSPPPLAGDTSAPTGEPPTTPSTPSDTPPTTDTATTPTANQLSGVLTSVGAVAILESISSDARVGYAAGPAGDVNGDGFADVLVGTTDSDIVDASSGSLHLFLGPLAGTQDMSTAYATWTGTGYYEHGGWLARSVGDVNGDGFDDILGQAHRYDGPGDHVGLAFVAFGPPAAGVHLMTDADVVLHGEVDGEGFGMGIAGIGDTNGDGRDDLAVGSGLLAPGAVSIWHDALVAGSWTTSDADAQIVGETAKGNAAGLAIAGLGDTDGDGLPDLLVADFWWNDGAGAAYVVHAPFTGTMPLEGAAGVVRGSGPDEFMAIRVDGADLDGDGLGDPVVQSWFPNRVYLFAGGVVGPTSPATAAATISIGASGDAPMASPGDLDQDGTAEILVAKHHSSSPGGEGEVYLFYGPHAGVLTAGNASAVIAGAIGDEFVGTAVGAAGDVNADGTLDLLVGAYGYDFGRGGVYLFDGI